MHDFGNCKVDLAFLLGTETLACVRQNLGASEDEAYSKDEISIDEKIKRMDASRIFKCYCEWNGLINWSGNLYGSVRLLDEACIDA